MFARSEPTPTTLLCFFFQAEDGIRDADVTGVQTCALPISARPINARKAHYGGQRAQRNFLLCRQQDAAIKGIRARLALLIWLGIICTINRRSEERRVGKECGSRWVPCD